MTESTKEILAGIAMWLAILLALPILVAYVMGLYWFLTWMGLPPEGAGMLIGLKLIVLFSLLVAGTTT